MNVGLFYNRLGGGPGKVVSNLVAGLKLINASVLFNALGEINGCLNQVRYDLPRNTLMGPNLIELPTDDPILINRYENFVVPSFWVCNKYKSFDIMKNKKIHVWSVGIDTEKFKPNKNIKKECLIYFKNRDEEDLLLLEEIMNKNNISYYLLKYGRYKEEELISKVNESRCAILLTNTESQGIAYMEILSMNTPCYVINQTTWKNRCESTSVPYFDDSCGMIVNKGNLISFSIFLNNINMYTPREYILNNHRLEISAKKYISLLEESQISTKILI